MFRLSAPCLCVLAVSATLACHPEPDTTPPLPTKEPQAEAPSAAQILAASNLPPLVESPLAGDEMGVTVHRLQNGLTVYISTERQEPRFSAWFAVRTGSRNDPPDSTGLAHYLEHMLFKGTDDYGTLDFAAERVHLDRIAGLYDELREASPARREAIFAEIDQQTQAAAQYAIPNELDRLYSTLGIEGVNAFTSNEVTAYIGDVPSNRLEAWATIEAERFADPVFRLFFPELEAVYEEKNLSLDRPRSRMWEALNLALFPEHPYGTQPTIGVTEHLKNPAYGDMVQYFEDWYAPNNMALMLAGDIDAATVLPVLERTLGQLPPRPIASPTAAALPPVRGRVVRDVVAPGEQEIMLAWRTVDAKHEDEPALVVLDWLMDNSSSGLLNLELEMTQQVQAAGSWVNHLNEAGYFGVRATLRPDQDHVQVEAMLRGVVAKLKAGEFSQADVDAVKLHADIEDKRALESNEARVQRMMDSFIERRAWPEVLARRNAQREVTREDVIRVANLYLGDDYVVINRKTGKPTLPKVSKPSITPIDIDATRQSPFAATIEAMPAALLEPEWLREGEHYQHLTLPAGPLVVAHNPRNDLFSLSYRFDRGQRKAAMLCVAFELLERSGADKTSADELQRQLFALGSEVRFNCGAESSSIEISGVDANLEASVALVETWMRKPSFDAATLDKLRDNILGRRRDELDDPESLGGLLNDFALYGQASPRLDAPSNQAIKKVDAAALRKLIAGALDHTHRTLYFGPRAPEEVAKVVALGKKHRPTGPRQQVRYRPEAKGTTIYFVHEDVAKSSLMLALPQGRQPREQIPVARYFAHYLSGDMSSLIFQEIREARGLAYSAFGYVAQGSASDDEWALLGYMSTQADKTNDALTTYLELLREPIGESRLAQSRSSLEASFRSSRVDPRWVVWMVEGWDRKGEPADPRPWEWAQIQTLGVDAVQSFATSYYDRPVIISIVGDRERIDLAALAKLGSVVEVQASDLVSYGAFEAPTPHDP